MEVDEGSEQNQTSSPIGWLRMRVWIMSLRSTVISWHGSNDSDTMAQIKTKLDNQPLVIVALHRKDMFKSQVPVSVQTKEMMSLFIVYPWSQVMLSQVVLTPVEHWAANWPLETLLGHDTSENTWAATWQNKQSDCAPSLIRVFAGH